MNLIHSISNFLGFEGHGTAAAEPVPGGAPVDDSRFVSEDDPAMKARLGAGLEVISGVGEVAGGAALGLLSAGSVGLAAAGVPLGLAAIGDGAARFTHGVTDLWNGTHTSSVISTAAQLAGLDKPSGDRIDAGISTALGLPLAATGTGALLEASSFGAKALGIVGGAAAVDALSHSATHALTGGQERMWLTQGLMNGFGLSEIGAGYVQAGTSLIAPFAVAAGRTGTGAHANAAPLERWAPGPSDKRFSNETPPVLGTTQHGLDTLNEVIAQHFDGRNGLIEVVGPSASGKGYVADSLKSIGRDVQVLEQDYFMAPPEDRASLINANIERSSNGLGSVEWRGFWDHRAAQGVLKDVRAALDSGIETDVRVPNAWHRKANEEGLNYFDEFLTIKPDTLVIWDAKFPVNRTPGGGRFDDFSLQIVDDPANIRTRYITRTEKTYQDPAVVEQKVKAYDQVLAPSYYDFLDIQGKTFAKHPDAIPDLILNVDPLYVAPKR